MGYEFFLEEKSLKKIGEWRLIAFCFKYQAPLNTAITIRLTAVGGSSNPQISANLIDLSLLGIVCILTQYARVDYVIKVLEEHGAMDERDPTDS